MAVPSTRPTDRGELAAGKPAKAKIIAHENVSISLYSDGTSAASHAVLNVHSNRMTFTQLSTPRVPEECPHATAWMLADAASEVLEDAHQDQPHL